MIAVSALPPAPGRRVPPWKLEAERVRPRLLGRLGWSLRATAYRVGLRRLALIRLAESEA